MTKRKVWRYCCEFCGKASLSGGHMGRHEKHCTANPKRICRMHANYEEPQRPMAELLAMLDIGSVDYGLAALRKATANCPICILSAIRQSGIAKWNGDPETPPRDMGFDFQAECRSAWATINEAKAAADGYY